MSNENTNTPEVDTDSTEYSATFTLTQHGMDGDFISSLKMEPQPDADNPALVHVLMHAIVSDFLKNLEVMDDDGNLMVEETGVPGLVRATEGTTKH